MFYQIAIKSREEIHLAPTLVIGFSMTLLRMLTFRPAPLVIEAPHAHNLTEKPTPTKSPSLPATNEGPIFIDLSIRKYSRGNLLLQSNPRGSNQNRANFNLLRKITAGHTIISSLKLTGLALNAVENAELISKEGRLIVLRVAKGHQSLFTPTCNDTN